MRVNRFDVVIHFAGLKAVGERLKALATLAATSTITWLELSIFTRPWQSTTAKWSVKILQP